MKRSLLKLFLILFTLVHLLSCNSNSVKNNSDIRIENINDSFNISRRAEIIPQIYLDLLQDYAFSKIIYPKDWNFKLAHFVDTTREEKRHIHVILKQDNSFMALIHPEIFISLDRDTTLINHDYRCDDFNNQSPIRFHLKEIENVLNTLFLNKIEAEKLLSFLIFLNDPVMQSDRSIADIYDSAKYISQINTKEELGSFISYTKTYLPLENRKLLQPDKERLEFISNNIESSFVCFKVEGFELFAYRINEIKSPKTKQLKNYYYVDLQIFDTGAR